MQPIDSRHAAGPQVAADDQPAPSPADAAYVRKAKDAAEKFEAHFIAQMLHQMRHSTRELAGEDSVFSKRTNEDMQDMTDNLMADALAGRHAFGIADVILRQLVPAAQQNRIDGNASFNSLPKTVAFDK
jgi:flagellar protein FlgJ